MWETDETIRFLINDEECYLALTGKTANEIKAYVVEEGNAPVDLYDSLAGNSSWAAIDWRKVKWKTVAKALKD